MSLFNLLSVTSSGMNAQRMRAEAMVENLANAETTRTADGGPYRRKDVSFSVERQSSPFSRTLSDAAEAHGVSASHIQDEERDPVKRFAPGHPDADKDGFVAFPNINIAEEMIGLVSASRGHQANAAAMSAVKDMIQKSLELFR
jgi:flagellar basal-body rod protein FlgC